MQPKAHRAIVRVAAARVGDRIAAHLPSILAGSDDEDVHVIAFFGLRLRLQAVGLTHTHRPNGRFGELWAPSAKSRCIALVGEAKRRAAYDPDGAAHAFGRACHLLVDVAVPARSRGVWHFYGDPLESWVEAHVDEIASMSSALPETAKMRADRHLAFLEERDPGALCESLARLSSSFIADTTRSTWGALEMRIFGRGARVSEEQAREQARVLVPAAIDHVAALLSTMP